MDRPFLFDVELVLSLYGATHYVCIKRNGESWKRKENILKVDKLIFRVKIIII